MFNSVSTYKEELICNLGYRPEKPGGDTATVLADEGILPLELTAAGRQSVQCSNQKRSGLKLGLDLAIRMMSIALSQPMTWRAAPACGDPVLLLVPLHNTSGC